MQERDRSLCSYPHPEQQDIRHYHPPQEVAETPAISQVFLLAGLSPPRIDSHLPAETAERQDYLSTRLLYNSSGKNISFTFPPAVSPLLLCEEKGIDHTPDSDSRCSRSRETYQHLARRRLPEHPMFCSDPACFLGGHNILLLQD